MKNSLVKNVFLGQLDYFVLERRGREIIKTASLHSSLGFGDADAVLAKGPVWGCPIALLFLLSPPLPCAAVGEKASAAGLLLRNRVLLLHLPCLLLALGTGAPTSSPSCSIPGRVILPRSSARSKCSSGSMTSSSSGALGRAEGPAGCCYPVPGRKGH